MKTIVLLTAAVIAGAVRYPAEGPINVRDEAEADRLIENGLAEDPEDDTADDGDDLDDKTIPALKDLAKEETIDLGEATRKPDIIAAIRKAREAKEG